MPTRARQATATEPLASAHAPELLDLDQVRERVVRIHQRVDLLEALAHVLEQVDLLPVAARAQRALAVAQALHAALRLVEQRRRQRAELLQREAVRVDRALEAQQRHDLGARGAVAPRARRWWFSSTQIASTASRSASFATTVQSRRRRSRPRSSSTIACSQADSVKARTQPSWWSRL